jgi:hypothetical protein
VDKDLLLFVDLTVDNIVRGAYSCFNWFKIYFSFIVIVDASDMCNVATFNIGAAGSAMREWNIKGKCVEYLTFPRFLNCLLFQ